MPVPPDPKGTQRNPKGESARDARGTALAGKKTSRQDDRGTRLTIEALPQDWAQWCRAETPILDPQRTWEQFSDYWCAVAGARGRKCDWRATWRNWCRKEADDRAAKGRHRVNGSKYNRQPGNDELAAWAVASGLGIRDGESWDMLRARVLPHWQEAQRE